MNQAIFPRREWITAQASYASQADTLIALVDRFNDQIRNIAPEKPQRIALVGVGASHAAAATAAYQLRRHGLDALRFLPSELPAGLSGFEGLTVLISQSGMSAEMVALAQQGLNDNAIALTNYAPTPLGALCPQQLNLGNFPDSSVSFASFTGTLIALGLLIDLWTDRNRTQFWKQQIAQAAEEAERQNAKIRSMAEMLLVHASNVDMVAPAPLMSVAEETALMFREGPRLFASSVETRQYLHGAMDAAGPGAHLVFGGEREAALISQLSERTRRLAFITGRETAPCDGRVHGISLAADLGDPLAFVLAATFIAQSLTLHTAAMRGIDIDEPAFQRIDTKTNSLTISA